MDLFAVVTGTRPQAVEVGLPPPPPLITTLLQQQTIRKSISSGSASTTTTSNNQGVPSPSVNVSCSNIRVSCPSAPVPHVSSLLASVQASHVAFEDAILSLDEYALTKPVPADLQKNLTEVSDLEYAWIGKFIGALKCEINLAINFGEKKCGTANAI